MTTIDVHAKTQERIDQLLARLGELVDQAPELVLAPALGDVHGPVGRQASLPPLAWPEGLPWPLTARQALDEVRARGELLASEMTAEIGATVAALVDPEAQATVLADAELVAGWPLPATSLLVENGEAWYGESYGARVALWRLLANWVQELPPADLGRWPDPALSHREVAQWAREPLNRLYPAKPAAYQAHLGLDPAAFAAEFPGKPAAGDALVAEVESWGEIRHVRWLPSEGRHTVELRRAGLAAVCLAVRRLPRNLAAEAWEAVQQWASDAPGDLHNDAARQALEKEKGPASAVATLARELHKRTPELVAAIAKPAGLAVDEVPERDGMLALDADLADWLLRIDEEKNEEQRDDARGRLAEYRESKRTAAALFARWLDGGALRAAARALWRTSVAALWERQSTRSSPAVIRAVAADRLIPAMAKQTQYLPGFDDGAIRDTRGRELGRIAEVATLDVGLLDQVRMGLDLLGSVPAHRLIRELVHRVHDQWEASDVDARTVDFEGGWSALAQAIRDQSSGHDRLRAILEAGQHVAWTHPAIGTIGGLWTWRAWRGNQTRPGCVRITVGDALAPGLAAMLADTGNTSDAARKARRLVPELRGDLPVDGVRDRDQGKAWTLHRLALIELVDRSTELATEGSVAIAPTRWRQLANDASFPIDTLPRLLDVWQRGDNKAPPLLRETEPGRFTLADTHAAERAFIEASGKARIQGRENARKGNAKKDRHRKG